jgi:hypothetical protein
MDATAIEVPAVPPVVPDPPVRPVAPRSGGGPVPPSPPADRRRGGVVALAALLVVVFLATAGLVWALAQDDDPPADDTAGSTSSTTTTESSTTAPTTASSPVSTTTATTAATTQVPSTSAPPTGEPASEKDVRDAIEAYYARIGEGDAAGAWDLLSPAYQARQTEDEYLAFWDSVDAVSVRGRPRVDEDAGTAELTLEFRMADGRTSVEDVVIGVVRGDDGSLLIDSYEVVRAR